MKDMLYKRRIILLILSFVALSPAIGYYVLVPLFVDNSKLSSVTVKIETYDYYNEKPIEIQGINLTFATRLGDIFSTNTTSENSGVHTAKFFPDFSLSLPIFLSSISLPRVWVLEKLVAEQEFTIADGRWSVTNLKASNTLEYIFSEVRLRAESSAPTLILGLKLYLAQGKVLEIPDPIYEGGRFDYRLRVSPIYYNFIESEDSNLAIVPIERPLTLNLSVSYIDFSWNINMSFDVGNRQSVDLTAGFVRAISSAQSKSLRQILDTLEDSGLRTADLGNRLNRMEELYEKSALEFEGERYSDAMIALREATSLCRDIYFGSMNVYTSVVDWVPTLVVVLLLFSTTSSCLITENRLKAIAVFLSLSLVTFSFFSFLHPSLKLFVFAPSFVTRRFSMPSFLSWLTEYLQVVVIILFTVVILFTRIREFVFQTFGVSIRSLRRRKLKTALALFTIVVVSASAMFLITFTPVRPEYCVRLHDAVPQVDNCITIRKTITTFQKMPSGTSSSVQYVPLQPYEIAWFSKDWVESVNIYGIKVVRMRRVDGFALNDSSTFNIVVTDPSFLTKHLGAAKLLGREWLSPEDRGMVLLGSKIASKHNITKGMEVLLNDRKFIVKAIFDEEIAQDLKDVDGASFLFQILDPFTSRIEGHSFIFASLNDFALEDFSIYKVAILPNDRITPNVTSTAEELLPLGFDFWDEGDTSFVSSYIIHVASRGSVVAMRSGEPILTITGSWQDHIVPIVITYFILLMNSLGTVSERETETRTIFIIGASPTRIMFMFMIEGLTLGITGGVFGYISGYAFAQVSSFLSPLMVQENLLGGTPFTISLFVAVTSSLLGCLLPSRVAIRSVVPRGKMAHKMSDIAEVKGGEANLEVPVKLGSEEIGMFSYFLEDLIKKYPGTAFSYREIGMHKISEKQTGEGRKWEILVNCSGEYVSDFMVLILAKQNEELKVLIKPLDVDANEIYRWTLEHRHNLKKIGYLLRQELLEFLTLKNTYSREPPDLPELRRANDFSEFERET